MISQYVRKRRYNKYPVEVCEQRDVKGHYRKARSGEIKEFTGISSPYEEPRHPDLVATTDTMTVEECVQAVIALLRSRSVIPERSS